MLCVVDLFHARQNAAHKPGEDSQMLFCGMPCQEEIIEIVYVIFFVLIVNHFTVLHYVALTC